MRQGCKTDEDVEGLRPLVPGLLLSLLACAGFAAGAPAVQPPLPMPPPMPPPTAADRVLVVSPHPDDESLCCAGLLQQALAAGAAVGIVWITDGDGFEIDAIIAEHTLRPQGAALRRLGSLRLREAHAAADLLGVPRRFQYVLGYPDRDIRALLGPNRHLPLRSTYTRVSAVATAEARSPGAAYTGENLARDLGAVLDDFAPTLVLAAAPQDLHSDHAASGQLTAELLAARGHAASLRWWIVHAGRHWPAPRSYHPALPLTAPPTAPSLDWHALAIDAAQNERKRAAIAAHKTQTEVMKPFLMAFVRRNELFAVPPGPQGR